MHLAHDDPDADAGRGVLEFLEPPLLIDDVWMRKIYLLDHCDLHLAWVEKRRHPLATIAESFRFGLGEAREHYTARAPVIGLECVVEPYSVLKPPRDLPRAYLLTLTIKQRLRAHNALRCNVGSSARDDEELLSGIVLLCRPPYEHIWPA